MYQKTAQDLSDKYSKQWVEQENMLELCVIVNAISESATVMLWSLIVQVEHLVEQNGRRIHLPTTAFFVPIILNINTRPEVEV